MKKITLSIAFCLLFLGCFAQERLCWPTAEELQNLPAPGFIQTNVFSETVAVGTQLLEDPSLETGTPWTDISLN